ncbi:chromosome segregation protein SMC [Sanguibacter antarcticus]|uniref:Chromosome partition protein Smc n=1 Tax=Sanguibacter antarcticus TaxID=372484 RepID=A0A2A9E5V3_9MICO|nr:chromosome segregation protein SMC [Sanguibacter antarcticus]PFG33569.1 condensin subunit Smc [Sanguibacter antarcticus]
MHLKTLTLRGFKSFASATTLSFEPGVTCVVGPNGSGKSNVVDALAWVMGEQGAKTLRGGKMEDVIFAGTSGRPPLGRAEVSLTIDNADGALPIEYSEVTITRTLFRSGGSEYAINGSSCRLLDIQDLLSDSGLGREMHVIVGQGQLDQVLRATPEERRGFIEEAAGVLKHRKRKEKALRKLESMQGNLLRLGDLTAEVRRQLGPLGRQAEAARKAAVVQADLRDSRARLLADDLAQLTASLAQEIADETALQARVAAVSASHDAARSALVALEEEAAAAAPSVREASETWYRLSSLRERITGLQTLASERLRLLGAPQPVATGADPVDLDRQAARARAAEAELAYEVEVRRSVLDRSVVERQRCEEAGAAAEKVLADLLRGEADRREGVARLAGTVAAKRSRLEAREAEVERLRDSLAEADRRGTGAQAQFAALENEVTGAQEGEEHLDAEHERATAALEDAEREVRRVAGVRSEAERDHATWSARSEALEMSLDRKDGAGALLESDLSGVVGSLAAMLAVDPGYEDAVAAALGTYADAIVVGSVDAAVEAIRLLRLDDAGRAALVVGGPLVDPRAEDPEVGLVELPTGASWARSVVHPVPSVRAGVDALLRDVVVVEDLVQAGALVDEHPRLLAVTRSGDVVGAHSAWGGTSAAPSVLHLQAALSEAQAALEDADARLATAARERDVAAAALEQAQASHDAALARLNESDASLAAVAEQLGHLGATSRAAAGEAARFQAQLDAATHAGERERSELDALAGRLSAAQAAPEVSAAAVDAAAAERDDLLARAGAARSREMDARLALRTSEERARALAGRAQSLERTASTERAARARAAEREALRVRQADLARAVRDGAATALARLDGSLELAQARQDGVEAERVERERGLTELRARTEHAATSLRELTDVAHRDEVARTQQQLRIEQLETRSLDELGLDPTTLLDDYGPDRPVPPDDRPYVRAEQEKRLQAAERAMARLGRVNPLALEEFAALEERHTFLTTQLADLKRSRTDLLEIVREIDARVEEVFTAAFHDTQAQFVDVFARLFPGGEGSLALTDPSDMLTTGIEIEARPAGKKVRRLSLLSGGERSLTAIALLVSIFKARPSPFYVMDEVEAALDDTNLGRLLEIFVELQRDSQLIVITHQKRTMEIADALYGVTMRGDGVTTVISQRISQDLRESAGS